MISGVLVIGLDGGLFFATADALEDRIRVLTESDPTLTGLVLNCEGIDFIDSQGAAKMAEIVTLADEAGLVLRLARVKPSIQATLERDGVLDRIGIDKLYGNIDQAVNAHLAEGPAPRPPDSDAGPAEQNGR